MGIALVLPNPRIPGVSTDYTWRFTINFDQRHWHFRGDRRMLGCDPAGRMFKFGTTMSQEDAWIALIPRAVLRHPPHARDVESSTKPTSMDPALALVIVAFFLHAMHKSGFHDVHPINPYPDVSSIAAFNATFNIQ